MPSNGLTLQHSAGRDDQFIPTGGDPRVNPQTGPEQLQKPDGGDLHARGSIPGVPRWRGGSSLRWQSHFQPIPVSEHRIRIFWTFRQLSELRRRGYRVHRSHRHRIHEAELQLQRGQHRSNTAFSIYNALQTSLTLANFHHWTGTASYTYSRTIDNVSEIFSTGSGGTTNAFAQNPLDWMLASAASAATPIRNVSACRRLHRTLVHGPRKGLLGRVLGGYFFNAFYQFNGGQPFNPFQNAIAQSPFVNAADPMASTIFCDFDFAQAFDTAGHQPMPSRSCRTIQRRIGTVGINTGGGNYINYATGVARSRPPSIGCGTTSMRQCRWAIRSRAWDATPSGRQLQQPRPDRWQEHQAH